MSRHAIPARARRGALLAVLATLVALGGATPVQAAKLRSGTATLTIDRRTADALKFFRVSVSSVRPARRSGRRFSFPVSGGNLTTGRAAGTIEHRGGIRFRFRGRSVSFRDLRISFARRSLTARVGGRRITVAAVLTDRAKASRDGFGTSVRGLRVFLSSAGGRALNRGLRARGFKRGLALGSMRVTAQPRAAELDGGESLVVVDPTMASLLSQQGIGVAPVAPSTASGAAFRFPINGGALELARARGEVRHTGGITFARAEQQLAFDRLVIDLDSTPSLTAAAGSTRASILVLDLAAAARTRNARQREIRIRGAKATLTLALATALNQAFATDVFAAGQAFGTLTIRASAE